MFEGMFPNLAKGKHSHHYILKRNQFDQNINNKQNVQHLSTGIPELGIEHFEPLIIDSVQVSKGSGSLILAGGFKNLIIKGPSNSTVSRGR